MTWFHHIVTVVFIALIVGFFVDGNMWAVIVTVVAMTWRGIAFMYIRRADDLQYYIDLKGLDRK